MIDWLIDGYNKTKDTLRTKLMGMSETELYDLNYKGLYSLLLEEIDEIDDIGFYARDDIADAWLGSYQGDMFVIFQSRGMELGAYRTAYACHVEYGSCSVCDTFLNALDSINDDGDTDKEKVADDLLVLILHMVQNTKILCRKI